LALRLKSLALAMTLGWSLNITAVISALPSHTSPVGSICDWPTATSCSYHAVLFKLTTIKTKMPNNEKDLY